MIDMNKKKFGLGLVVLSLVTAGAAFAHGGAHCDGKESAKTPEERAQHAAERFQKADKNGDGYLTAEEVGEKRWNRIQVADQNGDKRVSKAELDQARADGKLGHRGRHSA